MALEPTTPCLQSVGEGFTDVPSYHLRRPRPALSLVATAPGSRRTGHKTGHTVNFTSARSGSVRGNPFLPASGVTPGQAACGSGQITVSLGIETGRRLHRGVAGGDETSCTRVDPSISNPSTAQIAVQGMTRAARST